MSTTTVFVSLHAVTCFKCGIVFGLNATQRENLINSHDAFFCPAGHSQAYVGETDAEKLRKQLVATEQRLKFARDDRDAADRRSAAARGQVTKLKNRAHAGVCIRCNRTFENVARHMATKHAGECVE